MEKGILLKCPKCHLGSRYDTSFLEDVIRDGKEISCVCCGSNFEISIQAVETEEEKQSREQTAKVLHYSRQWYRTGQDIAKQTLWYEIGVMLENEG